MRTRWIAIKFCVWGSSLNVGRWNKFGPHRPATSTFLYVQIKLEKSLLLCLILQKEKIIRDLKYAFHKDLNICITNNFKYIVRGNNETDVTNKLESSVIHPRQTECRSTLSSFSAPYCHKNLSKAEFTSKKQEVVIFLYCIRLWNVLTRTFPALIYEHLISESLRVKDVWKNTTSVTTRSVIGLSTQHCALCKHFEGSPRPIINILGVGNKYLLIIYVHSFYWLLITQAKLLSVKEEIWLRYLTEIQKFSIATKWMGILYIGLPTPRVCAFCYKLV